jgi:hypothetical protein
MVHGVCNAIPPALAVTRLRRLVRCGVHMRVRGGEACGRNGGPWLRLRHFDCCLLGFQGVQTGLMGGSGFSLRHYMYFADRMDVPLIATVQRILSAETCNRRKLLAPAPKKAGRARLSLLT